MDGKGVDEFQSMWPIKEKDLAVKERLTKMNLFDRLLAKKRGTFGSRRSLKGQANYINVG